MLHLLLLIAHVLGASIVIGVVFFSLVIQFPLPLDPAKKAWLHFIGRFGMWASAWQFLTGLGLYWLEHDELNQRGLFWIKIGMYLLEGTLAGLVIEKKYKQIDDPAAGRSLRGLVVLQVALIVAIATIGVILVSGGEA